MHFSSNVTTLLVLRFHQADGELAQLFRLLQHITRAHFQLFGALLNLTLERFSQGAKSFLALPEVRLHAFAIRDISSRACNQLDVSFTVQDWAEYIFVVASRASWTGVRGLIRQACFCFKHGLNLPLKAYGKIIRIFQIEEVFADGVLEL